MSEVSQATQLLKAAAASHVKGAPIPPEIEAVADRWTWLTLKTTGNAKLKTPGRAGNMQFHFFSLTPLFMKNEPFLWHKHQYSFRLAYF